LFIGGTEVDLSNNAVLGNNTFTGDQDFGGNKVGSFVTDVVPGVSGALVAASHSGNVLLIDGDVTVPTTVGFQATLVSDGAHTVTFNGTSAPAMAVGDVMAVFVTSATTIKASLIQAADQVAFS
jgi:hypothetical protein